MACTTSSTHMVFYWGHMGRTCIMLVMYAAGYVHSFALLDWSSMSMKPQAHDVDSVSRTCVMLARSAASCVLSSLLQAYCRRAPRTSSNCSDKACSPNPATLSMRTATFIHSEACIIPVSCWLCLLPAVCCPAASIPPTAVIPSPYVPHTASNEPAISHSVPYLHHAGNVCCHLCAELPAPRQVGQAAQRQRLLLLLQQQGCQLTA